MSAAQQPFKMFEKSFQWQKKKNGRKKVNPPRRGIEPRSPAWQAGILTTILPRIAGVGCCSRADLIDNCVLVDSASRFLCCWTNYIWSKWFDSPTQQSGEEIFSNFYQKWKRVVSKREELKRDEERKKSPSSRIWTSDLWISALQCLLQSTALPTELSKDD